MALYLGSEKVTLHLKDIRCLLNIFQASTAEQLISLDDYSLVSSDSLVLKAQGDFLDENN